MKREWHYSSRTGLNTSSDGWTLIDGWESAREWELQHVMGAWTSFEVSGGLYRALDVADGILDFRGPEMIEAARKYRK